MAHSTDTGHSVALANPTGMKIAACRLARALTIVMIGLTAAVSLVWSHVKLLSQDEMYEFQTDSVRSLAQLVHVQRTCPISLDPLVYHSLSHVAMQIFGLGAFAQRLPALLGFLLMQVCLFFVVRRMAGERAGAVAATFPAVTATLFYAVEGRPYGLLLGLYALTLLCWQAATRRQQARAWALGGLTVGIAATLNTHYFGILLLAPLCVAEAWRTLKSRRVHWPVAISIVVGMAGIVTTRPFMKAAGEFRKNYYNEGSVGLHDITRAYRTLFVDYTKLPMSLQHLWMVALVLMALALIWGCVRVWKTQPARIPAAEWVFLIVLAALPFGGYLLARFVTHSIEVRYVLGALVAISALIGIAVSPLLESDGAFSTVMIILGLGIVLGGADRIHAEMQKTRARLDSLVMPEPLREALASSPDHRLYVQDMGAFEEDRYYVADPELKARITLIYSNTEEMRWNRHDTMALTAMHMQRFTDLPVVSYDDLRSRPGEHVFVLFHTGWDWTDQAFAQDHAHLKPLGQFMGGDAVAVTFPATP